MEVVGPTAVQRSTRSGVYALLLLLVVAVTVLLCKAVVVCQCASAAFSERRRAAAVAAAKPTRQYTELALPSGLVVRIPVQ